MKTFVSILLALLFAAGLAIASVWLATRQGVGATPLRNGVWLTDLSAGSASANVYVRAYVAREYLLALPKNETIYFLAFHDEQGNPLNDHCIYRIEGKPLAARWWSITLYAGDGYLIANPLNRYSYSDTTTTMNPDGTFTIWVAPQAHAGNWLPSTQGGGISLAARLYNPDPEMYEQFQRIPMPRVIKDRCP